MLRSAISGSRLYRAQSQPLAALPSTSLARMTIATPALAAPTTAYTNYTTATATHAHTSAYTLAAAAAAAVGVSFALATSVENEGSKNDSIVFNYEHRIRQMSSPEKVFDYFASVTDGGEKKMTPTDFMRALTPSAGPKGGDAPTPPLNKDVAKFFEHFDANNDGYISYAEYIFFMTLLAIPPRDFEVVFYMMDTDGDGVLDSGEFSQVMTVMKGSTSVGRHDRDGRRSIREVVPGSKQKSNEFTRKMTDIPYFFGEDGTKKLDFPKFEQFMTELQRAVVRLEFDYLDDNRSGTITASDFAQSMCGYADLKALKMLQPRIDSLAVSMKGVEFTFEEFYAFSTFLKNIDKVDLALQTYRCAKSDGETTRDTLARAARAATGVHLNPKQIEVIFRVFDANNDGTLDSEEFIDLLVKKANFGLKENRAIEFSGFLSCCKACWTSSQPRKS